MSLNMQVINNHTALQYQSLQCKDEQGFDTLNLFFKATFNIAPALSLAKEQLPLCMADEYFFEPGKSSLKYASDFSLGKLSTDVIIQGCAIPANQQEVDKMLVDIQVHKTQLQLAVFGQRFWQGNKITAPKPFNKMPLVFENAYGGKCPRTNDQDKNYSFLKNPVGKGYCVNKKVSNNLELPNVEFIDQLIQSPKDRPEPASLGFIAPSWMPRSNHAGTYDQAWQDTTAPDYPEDFNRIFNTMSNSRLRQSGYLKGGEAIAISGMSENPINFQLPYCPLWLEIKTLNKTLNPECLYESVLIEPLYNRLSIVWRSSIRTDTHTLRSLTIDYRQRR